MESKNTIEFYDGKKCIASVASAMVPPVGSAVSIRKQTWQVLAVSYALDHVDEYSQRAMRANVDLKAV